MKLSIITAIAFLIVIECFGQKECNNKTIEKEQNKYFIGFIPSKANNIFGIAIGPFGSEAICNKPYTKYSHGLNIQIPGQGILQIFYIFDSPFKQAYATNLIEKEIIQIDTSLKRVVHNGLIISPFGTFSDQVNGASISVGMSLGKIVNGISINLLWNLYYKINGLSIGVFNSSLDVKGVQIGIINKTVKLKGIQLGLWNKNKDRSLPLINWNFKD